MNVNRITSTISHHLSFQPHPFYQLSINSHFHRISSTNGLSIFVSTTSLPPTYQLSFQPHSFDHLSSILISTASLLPSFNSHFNRIPSTISHQLSFQPHPFCHLSSILISTTSLLPSLINSHFNSIPSTFSHQPCLVTSSGTTLTKS